ncbi:MAG: hypothetical protein HQK59_12955 [Deltaproteobacteria bacterium]|nr:hypothetical protein [Deltaproteobacteria bacterium]
METLKLRLKDQNIKAEILSFLKAFPPDYLEMTEEIEGECDEWYLTPVSDEEQAEIEEELRDPDCRVVASEELITIEL